MNNPIPQAGPMALVTLLTVTASLDNYAQSGIPGRRAQLETKTLAVEPSQDRGLFNATAIAELDPPTPEETQASPNLFLNAKQTKATSPLIITTTPISDGSTGEIEEDMMIMARLLADTLGSANATAWASGIPLVNYAKESKNRNLFIQGTGALFFLNVDFPLTGSGTSKKITEEAPKDTAWERARRKVYGSQSGNTWSGNNFFQSFQLANGRFPKPYKPQQVALLKERIATALGSASNIRALGANDRLWVIVSGPSAGPTRADLDTAITGWSQFDSSNPNALPFQPGANQLHANTTFLALAANKTTRLTISATKGDIDAFNDGRLTLKAFLDRLQSHAQ